MIRVLLSSLLSVALLTGGANPAQANPREPQAISAGASPAVHADEPGLLIADANPTAADADEPGSLTADSNPSAARADGPGSLTADSNPSAVLPGEPESITVEARPTAVRLGDPFEVEFVLVHAPGIRYHLEQPVKWGSLEVKEARIERGEGRTTVHVRAAIYDQLGDVELPAFSIRARGDGGGSLVELPGPALKIETISSGDELEDILPPVAVSVPSHTPWVVSLLALAVAVAGWLIWRNRWRWMPTQQAADVPKGPADERALARLEKLETGGLDDGRAYYFELSEIVRAFLEEVGRLPAMEMTTSELLEALEERPPAGLDRERFATWLQRGDGIRYAGFAVDAETAAADVEEARAFIRAVADAAKPSVQVEEAA